MPSSRRRMLVQLATGCVAGCAAFVAGATGAFATAAAPAQTAGGQAADDDFAPAFDLDGPEGRLRSESLRGQWVYLDFWASWCAPCRLSFPWMNDLHRRHGARGLRIVAINVDTRRADAERFIAELAPRFTVLFDPRGDTPRRHAIKAMPTSWLIDPQGRVVWRHGGFRAEERDALEARIAASLAEAAQPSATR